MRGLLWLAGLLLVPPLYAQARTDHLTKAIGTGLEAAALGLPVVFLLDDDPTHRETGRRMADALIMDAAITQALKWVVNSPRPHGGSQGFPSGHASLAFATATSLATREPHAAWIALPLAAVAGWTQVEIEEHTWEQFLAGAALGAFVGHMCGSGRWRLLARGETPLAAPSALGFLPHDLPSPGAPLPMLTGRDLPWETTLWSASF